MCGRLRVNPLTGFMSFYILPRETSIKPKDCAFRLNDLPRMLNDVESGRQCVVGPLKKFTCDLTAFSPDRREYFEIQPENVEFFYE